MSKVKKKLALPMRPVVDVVKRFWRKSRKSRFP